MASGRLRRRRQQALGSDESDGGGARRRRRCAQHILAVVIAGSDDEGSAAAPFDAIRDDFQKTTSGELLPCSFRCYGTSSGSTADGIRILLGSNYPHCILEEGDEDLGGDEEEERTGGRASSSSSSSASGEFVALCGGFPYGYNDDYSCGGNSCGTRPSLASHVLRIARSTYDDCRIDDDCTETHEEHDGAVTLADYSVRRRLDAVRRAVGEYLLRVSGHFVALLCHVPTGTMLAYNDPFGFMPVFFAEATSASDRRCVAISSSWDCVARDRTRASSRPPRLNLDVVAEYLTLGTTLGGSDGTETFVEGVRNAPPGSCLRVGPTETPATDRLGSDRQLIIAAEIDRYTKCYGACELALEEDGMVDEEERANGNGTSKQVPDEGSEVDLESSASASVQRHFHRCRSDFEMNRLEVEETKPTTKIHNHPDDLSHNDAIARAAYNVLRTAVRQTLEEGTVTGAALTGGGDTRLILSCMPSSQTKSLVFQTHNKQKTDLILARHLASTGNLRHVAVGTGVPRNRERALALIHDQVPGRNTMRRGWLSGRRTNEDDDEEAAHVLHGRFGTEQLGFLCYVKTSVPVRSPEDVENVVAPPATQLFCALFRDEAGVRNPVDVLSGTMRELQLNRDVLEDLLMNTPEGSGRASSSGLQFDAPYALQLLLFTRAFLCDIYGGLRGGSWFAMPCAYFARNGVAASPFLDGRLLRLLLTRLPAEDKWEPYRFYGRMFRRCVPPSESVLRSAPCNNKLLCKYAGMPRAVKMAEAPRRVFRPEMWRSESGRARSERSSSRVTELERLKSACCPFAWDGAIAIALLPCPRGSVATNAIAESKQHNVKRLVGAVGAEQALVLSERLQSFLLWYERRFVALI